MSGGMNENMLKKHEAILLRETNETLRKGTLVASILGFSAAIIIFITQYLGIVKNLTIPAGWAITGGLLGFSVFILASKRLIQAWVQYLVILFFSFMPTSIYVMGYFMLPAGAATYITGPPSYIYFFFIILTGYFFNARISIITGVLAAIQYTVIIFISQEELRRLHHPDALLLQDFTSLPIYLFKPQMMIFSGIVMGTLARTVSKLISSILKEEHDKETIDRLFGQYMSPEVKNKLLSATTETQGELKNVAVLFCDIRSFSTLSEGMQPAVVVEQLNRYFDKMVTCINQQGGVIDKFIGDAIMANFGGVLDLKNACNSALLAAKSMLKELAALNRSFNEEGMPGLGIGIGIHFGPVLQGNIGSHNRKEFTIIGDTVNIASRIEGLSKEMRMPIIVSNQVYEMLEDELMNSGVELGKTQVKGRQGELTVYGYK